MQSGCCDLTMYDAAANEPEAVASHAAAGKSVRGAVIRLVCSRCKANLCQLRIAGLQGYTVV